MIKSIRVKEILSDCFAIVARKYGNENTIGNCARHQGEKLYKNSSRAELF
jgi:hypothetical protein